jgi:hypothetical protein
MKRRSVEVITQAALAHYRILKLDAEQANKSLASVRQHLIDQANAGVEPGPYGLKVEARESRRFSYDGMVDAIGRLQADRIKDLLPLQTSTFVTVSGPLV